MAGANGSLEVLASFIRNYQKKANIMEVCGTHTFQFFATGIRDMLPEGVRLLSGPGCPVCVTPNSYIDRAKEIAKRYDVIIATFGDMLKVPGSDMKSLAHLKAEGADIRVVYSPEDAVRIAASEDRPMVFLSVGFETTIPTAAAALMLAEEEGIKNFYMLPSHKLIIPALRALLEDKKAQIDGFILPGHVSAIIGRRPYEPVLKEYGKPGVITGFEAHHLIIGTAILLKLIQSGRVEVINAYPEVVREEGNPEAWALVERFFEPADERWRGFGLIPLSGHRFREDFSHRDAARTFPVDVPPERETPGCRCPDVVKGKAEPTDCPHFGKGCTPLHPLGPCMVSSEGACAAYYKYRRQV
jgi:hydrogenase expression/formation protein HypD